MKTGDLEIKGHAYQLERASWALVGLSMLTQLDSTSSFPSYNIALGFWGLYCAFSKQGRATFGLIIFSFFASILDIVFCSLSESTRTSTFTFCLVMLILCLLLKVAVLYISAHFFASLGGANSMDSSNLTTSSVYEPLSSSMENSGAAMYYPSQGNPLATSNSSFTDSLRPQMGQNYESV